MPPTRKRAPAKMSAADATNARVVLEELARRAYAQQVPLAVQLSAVALDDAAARAITTRGETVPGVLPARWRRSTGEEATP